MKDTDTYIIILMTTCTTLTSVTYLHLQKKEKI